VGTREDHNVSRIAAICSLAPLCLPGHPNFILKNLSYSHGKDNTLRIWQLRHQDELGTLSTTLPKDAKEDDNPKPWLLHALPVNTLNFCSFSMCYQHPRQKVVQTMIERMEDGFSKSSVPASDSILVAVPATDDKMIDVYRFPGEQLKVKIPRAQPIETGMCCN
jgi:hypothetical protein